MDKETLSNYGWIVVCVMVLAVLLALASPFGTFVAGAIKSTTAGLFNVNQAALGSAGIDVNDMVFENCDHLETELRNVTDTYTGDTCCKTCGTVMSTGQTVRPKVAEGATYTAADGTIYNPGDEMPEPTTGDKYKLGYYEYGYNMYYNVNWKTDETQDGWGVRYYGTEYEPTPMLEYINGKNITTLYETFQYKNLTIAPKIPSSVTSMHRTFYGCNNLTTAPNIPEGVINLDTTFGACKSLAVAPTIPSTVTNMYQTFTGCEKLTVVPDMSKAVNVTNIKDAFRDCKSLVDASTLVIPNSVLSLERTFMGCTSLKNLPNISHLTKLTDLPQTFQNCGVVDLSGYILPANLTAMKDTFSGCKNLTAPPVLSDSLKDLYRTFANCTSLTIAPLLPSNAVNTYATFQGCTSLKTYVGSLDPDGDFSNYIIPNTSNHKMYYTFENCTSMIAAPTIPESVRYIYGTFKGCTSLTGTITIEISYINNINNCCGGCFNGVDFEAQNLTLDGTCTMLDAIGATGTNYCADCNGKCNGGH